MHCLGVMSQRRFLLLGAEELKEQTDFFAIHWHTYREGEAVSLLG